MIPLVSYLSSVHSSFHRAISPLSSVSFSSLCDGSLLFANASIANDQPTQRANSITNNINLLLAANHDAASGLVTLHR